MVAYSFASNQHDPSYGSSGGLPAGKFKVVIASTKGVPTKNGDGQYLALELKVIEGPQTGGTQTDRLNLFNSNPDTVRIANGQLSAYCHVTGKFQFQDTDELCNIPFWVEIGPQKNGEYTEVKKLYDINGNEPGKAGAGQQVQHQQQQGGGPVAGFGADNGQGQQQGGGFQQNTGVVSNNGFAGGGNQGQGGGWSGGGQGQQQQQPQDQGQGGQQGGFGGGQQGGGQQQQQGGFGGGQGGGQAQGGGWQGGGGNAGGGAAPWGGGR